MSFYEGMAQTAYDLLSQFGQTVIVRTKHTEDYDLESGDVTEVETSETGIGVLLPGANPELTYDQNPARVHDTVTWVISASGLTVAPVPGSVIDGDGYSWSVIGLTPLSPAGTVIVYKCLAKKMGTD